MHLLLIARFWVYCEKDPNPRSQNILIRIRNIVK